MNEALLVRVHKLDGIFDGDDVSRTRVVDQIDDCGERRRLAGARRTGDENESAAQRGDSPELIGQRELFERHDLRRDDAEHRPGAAATQDDRSVHTVFVPAMNAGDTSASNSSFFCAAMYAVSAEI